VRDAYATPRVAEITGAVDGIEDEDLIEREDMVVTVTVDGYIKRTSALHFRAQNRGGKGRAGMATKEEDAVSEMFVTSTHTPVLFFSTAGKVYRLKVWKLPEGGPTTRGRPIINLLPSLDTARPSPRFCHCPRMRTTWGALHVVFATAKGNVRRNSMDAFANIPSNGKFAMRFEEDSGDRLIGVALLDANDDVLLASRGGKAIRFAGDDVREFQSRTSTGVRGMLLKGDDEVISLSILHRVGTTSEEREEYVRFAPWKAEREGEPNLAPERFAEMAQREQFILTVCANGYGKLRRPTNTGAPVAADRASPISTISRAMVRSWPALPDQGRSADARHQPGQADPHGPRIAAHHRSRNRRACACSTSDCFIHW
jgi:DNA gyrase subunit A